MRVCVFVLVCVLVEVASGADFLPEDGCSASGGICAPASECIDSTLETGLCPKQQSQGAECCHRVASKRCKSHGGECTSECPEKIARKDLECENGEHRCCIWL